ncbi:triose-phosphate isomerase [Candidatus Peregrinibacteria bacterium]|nr:triose-phosphate isomerase [Candidatus Peregrinibacteria bacterium]
MKLPLILVNFKLYEQATGERALKLAKIHEKIAEETGASIAIAVNALDLQKVSESVNLPVFSQHVDPVGFGSYTGRIMPYAVKGLGAYGTLLNHAEYPVEYETLRETVERSREAGLFVIVCADTAEQAEKVASFNPDLVAVEPPELIGGDISVSKAEPEIVENAVRLVGENRVLVGAGVKSAEDVKIALSLGAAGVLLASGITKAEDPYYALLDLVSGLK